MIQNVLVEHNSESKDIIIDNSGQIKYTLLVEENEGAASSVVFESTISDVHQVFIEDSDESPIDIVITVGFFDGNVNLPVPDSNGLILAGDTNSSLYWVERYTHPIYPIQSADAITGQVIDTFSSDDKGHVTNISLRYLTVNDIPNLPISKIINLQNELDNRYTETELQTSGLSSVHWDNITNVPNTITGIHADLNGLDSDDHTQYALLDGRANDILKIDSINEFTLDAGVTIENLLLKDGRAFNFDAAAPTLDNELANKKYVDDNAMVYPSAGIAVSTGSAWGTSIVDNSTNWNEAYSWGNHSLAGYLTDYTETDPIFNSHTVSNIINGTGFLINDGAGNWSYDNTTYLDVETDPIFTASAAYGITSINISNWNDAYDHSIITTGNPHNISLTDIGESQSSINYWTKTGTDLSYSGGNVGIGIDEPFTKVHIVDSEPTLRLSNSSVNNVNSGTIEFSEEPNTSYEPRVQLTYDGAANKFHIKTGSGTVYPRMTFLRDSYNVGINKTDPAYTLDVNGTGNFDGNITANGFINPFEALTAGTTTWDTSTGLSKTWSVSANATLTLSNLVNGMYGDVKITITNTPTITLAGTGITFKGNGSLSSLSAGIYHLCWVCTSSSTVEWNIAKYE